MIVRSSEYGTPLSVALAIVCAGIGSVRDTSLFRRQRVSATPCFGSAISDAAMRKRQREQQQPGPGCAPEPERAVYCSAVRGIRTTSVVLEQVRRFRYQSKAQPPQRMARVLSISVGSFCHLCVCSFLNISVFFFQCYRYTNSVCPIRVPNPGQNSPNSRPCYFYTVYYF